MLTNTASDRVRRVRRLTRRSARAESGRLLVEGPQACREAALAGLVTDLYFTADAASAHPEIVSATLAAAGRLHQASSDYVSAISSDAQGIAAVAGNPWADWTIAEGLGRAVGRPALVAVFEQVRDPGNAGAVIRAADAAGSDLVVFADQSTDPAAPKAVRASAGSYFHLPVVVIGAISQAIGLARAAGLTVLAADGHGREPLGRAALGQSTAWLFGNEARGLSAAALAGADQAIRIEIYGRAESLNLAMAATRCLYASASALGRDEILPPQP